MKQTFGKIIGKALAPCAPPPPPPTSYGPVRNVSIKKPFVKSSCQLTEKTLLDFIYTV